MTTEIINLRLNFQEFLKDYFLLETFLLDKNNLNLLKKNTFKSRIGEGFFKFFEIENYASILVFEVKASQFNLKINLPESGSNSPFFSLIDFQTRNKNKNPTKFISSQKKFLVEKDSILKAVFFQFSELENKNFQTTNLPLIQEVYQSFNLLFQSNKGLLINDLAVIYRLISNLEISYFNTKSWLAELSDISEADLSNILLVERKETDMILEKGVISSIKSLSKQCYMSQTKFKNLFRIIFQDTPHEYFLLFKMNLAKELISSKKFSVSQVSSKLGYKSTGKFSSAFNQKFNVLPSQLLSR